MRLSEPKRELLLNELIYHLEVSINNFFTSRLTILQEDEMKNLMQYSRPLI